MSTHRFILTGTNRAFPQARQILGYTVEGVALTAVVEGTPCPDCEGQGEILRTPINPSERDYAERCEMCQGAGVVE